MKYIPKELMTEIRTKYAIIGGNPNYNSQDDCRKIASKRIEKNAQVHSYRIENPYLNVPFSVSRNNRKKGINCGLKNIESAFTWGINNFNTVSFEESFIREIAGRITPELYDSQTAQYRDRGISITGASTTPPYPEKLVSKEIPWFVESLKRQLSCDDVINKVQTAIFAHLHLARIHPFDDGNGRTARTIQDIILYNYGLPSPLIESGERYFYYQALDKAILDWDEKKALRINNGASEGESLFYTFMAGKINSSLDKLVNRCRI
jgi:fido (protein-threonine AMPylation protein)